MGNFDIPLNQTPRKPARGNDAGHQTSVSSDGAAPNRAVVAISTGSSQSPSSGHFYWHYLGLVDNGQIPPNVVFRVLGSRNLTHASAIPLFTERAHQRRFKVGASTIFDYRFLSIEKTLGILEGAHPCAFYIYEGSLADLALVFYLAPRMADSAFVFNLFWPLDWQELIERRRWFRRLLGHLLRTSPINIRFSADTPKLAGYLSKKLNFDFHVWPPFSPLKFGHQREIRRSNFDILIVFKRPEDLNFALDVIEKVGQNRDLNIALQGPTNAADVESRFARVPRCKFTYFGSNLDHDNYVDLLMSSGIVFLSYLKNHYDFGSSGKVMDAHQAGCATLVPEGSGIHSQVAQLRLEAWHTFSPGDTPATAKKLLKLVDQPRRFGRTTRDYSRLLDFVFEFQDSLQEKQRFNRKPCRSGGIGWAILLGVGWLLRPRSRTSWRPVWAVIHGFRSRILK